MFFELMHDASFYPETSMDVELNVNPLYLSDFAIDFGAGLMGGCAGLAFGHPFDTIKVRQQTALSQRLSMMGCIRSTMAREGVRGFFKGMAFPLAAVGFQNSIFFGVYGTTIRHLTAWAGDGTRHSTSSPSYGAIFIAGAFAGAIQGVFACPIDLVKVKLQTDTCVTQCRYNGPVNCLKSIYHLHGLKGVTRGMTATILREIPGLSVYITSYQWMCDAMTPAEHASCSVPRMLLAGGIAGMLSWMVNIPVDIVKSRMQNDDMTKPRYKNTLDCFLQSYRNDGWRVFWRGLPVTCIRAFPTNAVTFAVYSTSLQYMQNSNKENGYY